MSLAVTYLDPATLSLNADGIQIVLDPSLPSLLETQDAADLQPDYILQTSALGASLEDSLELARRSEATIICHADLAPWFQQHGIRNVHGMSLGSGQNFPFGKVIMTLAHQAASLAESTYSADVPVGSPVSFLIHFNDGLDVYIAGNSAQTADMQLIGKAGGVDLAFLPLGDQPHNGSDDAVRAAQLVQAKHVIPLLQSANRTQEGTILAERLRRVAEIDTSLLPTGETVLF